MPFANPFLNMMLHCILLPLRKFPHRVCPLGVIQHRINGTFTIVVANANRS
jgi:hypothetical protein